MVRKLTIAVAVVIVFLLGIVTAIAYFAATGEDDEPVKRATVSTAQK